MIKNTPSEVVEASAINIYRESISDNYYTNLGRYVNALFFNSKIDALVF
jgi:hypothetical protein